MSSLKDLREFLKSRGYNNINHLNRQELYELVELNGGDVFGKAKEIITRVKGFLTGARKTRPPQIKELLDKYGEYKILSIKVCREPVNSFIKEILNTISYGEFQRNIKRYNYDDLFHLYLVITIFNKGKVMDILMEKNHVVEVKLNKKVVGDCMLANYNEYSNPLTLNKLLVQGEKFQGESYWIWNVDNNCQVFVISTLKGSNLLTNNLQNFVLQCASCVVNGKLKNIANTVVDLASRADILLYGSSLQVGGQYIHSSPITREEQEKALSKKEGAKELYSQAKNAYRLADAISNKDVVKSTQIVQELVNKVVPNSGIFVPTLAGITDVITGTRHYEPGEIYRLTVDALPLPNEIKDKLRGILPQVNQAQIDEFHRKTRLEYDWRKKYAYCIDQTTGKPFPYCSIPPNPVEGGQVKRPHRIGVAVKRGGRVKIKKF